MKYSERVAGWLKDMIEREIKEVYDNISQEHLFEKTDIENAEIHRENIEEMNDYLAELDRLKIDNGVTVQEWISVKDRLPIEEAKAHEQEWCEEYCEFLVMIEGGLIPTTLYYDLEEGEWFRINTALERETYKVTYWMPLPQPPKGE